MLRTVIALFVALLFHASAFARQEVAMGLAMESRVQREVNPDIGNLHSLGMVYAKWKFAQWSALFETGLEEHDSGTGSLNVKTETIGVGLWGRYDFYAPDRGWSPFAGVGVGSYFDRVNADFQDSHEERSGTRKFAGLGVGVDATFWQHFLVEGEGRMNFVELSKDPVFSAIFRVGAVF